MLIKGQAELSNVYHDSNTNLGFFQLYVDEIDLWNV